MNNSRMCLNRGKRSCILGQRLLLLGIACCSLIGSELRKMKHLLPATTANLTPFTLVRMMANKLTQQMFGMGFIEILPRG